MSDCTYEFREKVWDYYRDHGRHDLPWRLDVSPYSILVSEVMLQQTQVARVIGKYAEWMASFPDMQSLAGATGAEVFGAWQGLGYNSRGLRLREAARQVMADFGGILPSEPADLVKLPGIGPNTAGSISAFAYNRPVVFIETNIRRVFIHEFFPETEDGEPVNDSSLKPLIESALDLEHPREWYWALMDYGSWLARQVSNPNRRSRQYVRQSKFEGSVRQIRGEVLRQLLGGPKRAEAMGIRDERLEQVLRGLVKDGLIEEADGLWHLAK